MSQSGSPDPSCTEPTTINNQRDETARSRRIVRNYIACRRCHTQKVKCSGETPCRNCKGSKNPVECVYPVRDRKVAVSESYLKKLEAEVQTLKRKSPPQEQEASPEAEPSVTEHNVSRKRAKTAEPPTIPQPDASTPHEQAVEIEADGNSCTDGTNIEPYVGEAACTTFGTKLRQFLQGGDAPPTSSRPKYYQNQRMLRASCTECQLPNKSDAQLLVRVVLRFIGPDYHLLRRTSFLERLEETYKLEVLNDPIWLCRLFTVFALGEIYTVRSHKPKDNGVPGVSFFLKALDFFQDLYEEPTVEYIETLLLLAFYSTTLNRRNTAYTYIGLAMRLSMMMGLHRKIPPNTPIPPPEREHRIRVWWTVYVMDRMMSSKIGHPAMIQDTDIDVQLPSLNGLSSQDANDFYDPAYLLAQIALARITGNVLGNIYHIPNPGQRNSFVHGVHTILARLKSFHSGLPPLLRLEPQNSPMYANRTVASLHLHLNQCVILTTRPILFYVFRQKFGQQLDTNTGNSRPQSQMVSVLSDACIQTARASNKILSQLWVDGCLAMYGFYDALSIFSSTLILMLASAINELDGTPSADEDNIGVAWSLLRSMKDDGSVPATDYYEQLVDLKDALQEACTKKMKERLESKVHASNEKGASAPMNLTDTLSLTQSRQDNINIPTDVGDAPGMVGSQQMISIGEGFIDPSFNGLFSQSTTIKAPQNQPWAPAALESMFSANTSDQLLWDFDWESVGILH